MSSYSILHGSTSNSSCLTRSKISYDREMQQLRGVAETVSKVLGPEDTIKFVMNTQEFIYTVYMFRDILHLLVETPDNPFVAPVNIETIEAFMNKVGYQVRQKKEAIQYPRFIKLLLADLMKKFLEIPQRIEEDYHSIKDDIPLVSVYTTRDVRVRGMLIPDEFLTEEFRATDDFKEYETVFIERDAIAKATLLSLALHKTALAAEAQENIAKVQEKLNEEEFEKMVEGEEDEVSYASVFVDSVFNDDVHDFGTRLEPESHKENPKKVDDDYEEIEKEKDDEEIEKETKDE
ncbi:hypothetical protein Tco_1032078 [Tanacetum coccineum]|uniref:Uncharacterized protein n=1 Tax=Tanacetum coccineum TaxID=301880 RepID=A0ABQ5GCX8_9ASTR